MQPNGPPQNYQPHPQPQYHQPQTQQVPVQQYGAQPGTVIVHGQNAGAQAGAAVGITLIVGVIAVVGVIVLAGVLYVWANSLAADGTGETSYDVDINIIADPDGWGGSQTVCQETGITIESGQYYGCSFGLNEDAELDITVDVGRGGAVNIYTMTQSNFEKWERDEPFDYFYSLSRTGVYIASLNGDLNSGQDYVVVVANA